MDFYKSVEKNGIVIEFKELRENELKSRLKKICLLYKVEISDQNISHLIEISGTKMQNLINEIRKLIEYAGEGGKKMCIRDRRWRGIYLHNRRSKWKKSIRNN